MGITYSQAVPYTYEDAQKKALDQQKVYSPSVTQAATDLWDGFKEENLLYMAYDEIVNGQKYEGDANYSYVNDPQLEGYEQIKDQFMFSRNAQETTDILAQLKHNASIEKESPYYFLGRITGAIADPSSYLLFSKAARSAKVFGTAATTEEIIKQNLDPLRDDSFVPIVGLASFVIPAVINKFTTPVPEHVIQKSVKLADDWIPPVNKNSKKMVIKELDGSSKIYEDGVLKQTLYRGTGGEGKINIASGNIFEDATFTTTSKDIAGMYGKNVETVNQTLSNPIIIKNDGDLIKFFETTGKKYSNYDYVKVSEWVRNRYKELRAKEIDPEMAFKIIDKEATKVFGYNYKFSNFYMSRPFQNDIDNFRKTIVMPIYNKAKDIALKKGHDGVDVKIGVSQGGSKVFDEKSPVQINKLINEKKILVDQTFSHDQTIFFNKLRNKADDIMEDGVLVNPNKVDTAPSGVGAAVNTDTKNLSTAGKRLEGEAFVKSYFSKFGEEGPWTPVFRVMKSATTNGRKMMSDILDTPLLKLKNTKDWGFQSTGASLEVQLKMEEVAVIESMKDIKTAYMKYLESIGQTKPKTEIGVNWRNTLDSEAYSMSQFSQEIVRARITGKHPNQFVEEAARITQEKVYGPLMEQIKKYKLREAPVEQELAAMESVLKMLRDTKQVRKVVKSKIDGKTATWTVELLEAQIKKLTDRLANIKNTPDGVKNYINIIYNKTAIDNNPALFKKIIKDFLVRKNITMNEAKLNKLVEDLSGHFPFTRFEKRSWDKMLVKLDAVKNGGIKELNEIIANERFLFNRPRYARASKARHLNLDAEAQLALLDAGMIGNDIFALQKAYYRQIVPDILLTKKYGDTSGMGYKYVSEAESMTEPGLLQVAAEYNMKIGFTQNKAKRLALVKEKNQVLGDLEAAVELLRGTYGLPSNPHHWTSVAMRTMKHYNALTMLTGFAAAIPDAARVVMTSGIKRGFQTQFEMLADSISGGSIFKLGKKEAQSWGEAVDLITNQRAMLFADMPSDMFGFVNKMESAMGKTSQFNFMYINLMSRWTEMAKSMASVTIGSRIIEDSIKWGKGGLSDKWKTALASSGIDEQMAKRIAVQFETHGTKLKHNFIAGTSEWTDDAAKKAFGAALNKDINITIVTPGKGDTALWMSTELGSTIAQFKKFAAAASQRILLRGMQERDADFLFGSMLLLGSGMMIDGLYHKYRFNRDYGKLSLSEKLINAFDRSGLAGIYSDVNKAIETLTDNRFGISPLLGAGKPYGSSTRWKMGTILGPSGGQIYNIFDIIYDVAGGKYNHHTAKNVRRLIPWQNVWYLDWLFDDIQKGLK